MREVGNRMDEKDIRASQVLPVDSHRGLSIYKVVSRDKTEHWYDVDHASLIGECFTSPEEAKRMIDQFLGPDTREGDGVAFEGLPPFCFTSVGKEEGAVLMVTRLSQGYIKMSGFWSPVEVLRAMVDKMNESIGVTRAQEEAMKAGCLYGWDKFASDPAMYDEEGKSKMGYSRSERVDYDAMIEREEEEEEDEE